MTRKAAAILLDILILLLALTVVIVTGRVLDPPAPLLTNLAVAAVGLLLLGYELYGIFLQRRETVASDIPRTLSLLGINEKPLHSWELIGRTDALVGKSAGDVLADIDLSGSDFAELLEAEQVVLAYNDTGWWATACPTRNGSQIIRRGQNILLTPGVPVRLLRGDILLLADEIRLALN